MTEQTPTVVLVPLNKDTLPFVRKETEYWELMSAVVGMCHEFFHEPGKREEFMRRIKETGDIPHFIVCGPKAAKLLAQQIWNIIGLSTNRVIVEQRDGPKLLSDIEDYAEFLTISGGYFYDTAN